MRLNIIKEIVTLGDKSRRGKHFELTFYQCQCSMFKYNDKIYTVNVLLLVT